MDPYKLLIVQCRNESFRAIEYSRFDFLHILLYDSMGVQSY